MAQALSGTRGEIGPPDAMSSTWTLFGQVLKVAGQDLHLLRLSTELKECDDLEEWTLDLILFGGFGSHDGLQIFDDF